MKTNPEQDNYIQDILNAFNDLIFVLNDEGVFTDMLSSESDALIVPKTQFIGKYVHDILPPEVSAEVEHTAMKQLRSGETDCYRLQYSLKRPGQPQAHYLAFITRIEGKLTGKSGFLVVVRDVSELQRKDAFIHAVFKNAFLGIMWLEAKRNEYGNITDYYWKNLNDEAARLLRRKKETLLNIPFSEYIGAEWYGHFDTLLKKVLETGEPHSEIKDYSDEGQGEHWARIQLSKFGENGIIACVSNVTELMYLNNSLRRRNDELIRLNKRKNEVLSTISHDLRSPLAGILGLLQVIRHSEPDISAESGQYLDLLEENARKMQVMLDDILNWSRSSFEQSDMSSGQLNLYREVEWVSQGLIQVEQKNIQIVNRVDEDFLLEINRGVLRTILRNLLNNAVKFSFPGSEVVVESMDKEGFRGFFVQDSGLGMDALTMEHLMNGTQPDSRPGTQGEVGTGMGIELIKRFLEPIGGQMIIESEPGKGSRFQIWFPESVHAEA